MIYGVKKPENLFDALSQIIKKTVKWFVLKMFKMVDD